MDPAEATKSSSSASATISSKSRRASCTSSCALALSSAVASGCVAVDIPRSTSATYARSHAANSAQLSATELPQPVRPNIAEVAMPSMANFFCKRIAMLPSTAGDELTTVPPRQARGHRYKVGKGLETEFGVTHLNELFFCLNAFLHGGVRR